MEPDMPDYTTSVTGDDVGVDDRAICYWETDARSGKRTLVIRASASGACIRALVAAALGYEEQRYARADEIMHTAANEGMLHEGSVLERLEAEGYEFLNIRQQAFTETQVIPGVVYRGHIDGWATSGPDLDENDEAVAEIKTMSVARYKEWQNHGFSKFRKYAWQFSTYMWHYIKRFEGENHNIKGLYAVKNRNTGELMVNVVDEPPVSWKELRDKAIEVLKWVNKGELPPCDPNLESGERYFCPFVMLHDEDVPKDEDIVATDTIAMILAGMAQAHFELTEQMKPFKLLDTRRKEIAEQMKPHLTGKRTIAGGYRVKRIDVNKPNVNIAKVKEALGVTDAEFTEQYMKPGGFSYYQTEKLEDD